GLFEVTIDRAFREVMEGCAEGRAEGSWITPEFVEAYTALHERGHAHRVEGGARAPGRAAPRARLPAVRHPDADGGDGRARGGDDLARRLPGAARARRGRAGALLIACGEAVGPWTAFGAGAGPARAERSDPRSGCCAGPARTAVKGRPYGL